MLREMDAMLKRIIQIVGVLLLIAGLIGLAREFWTQPIHIAAIELSSIKLNQAVDPFPELRELLQQQNTLRLKLDDFVASRRQYAGYAIWVGLVLNGIAVIVTAALQHKAKEGSGQETTVRLAAIAAVFVAAFSVSQSISGRFEAEAVSEKVRADKLWTAISNAELFLQNPEVAENPKATAARLSLELQGAARP